MSTEHATSLLDSVRKLEPLLREHSAAAEQNRRLSDPVVDALRQEGFFRMWRPKAFGGLELDPVSACRVVEELSRIDSAAGWNVQISNAVELFGPSFPDEGAREIYGEPDTILSGGLNPPYSAVPVEGGYRITGRAPFLSGAHFARWFFGLSVVMDGEQPRMGPNGMPLVLIHACPAKDASIVDTWHTMGMRGTGSHDAEAKDVFLRAQWTTPLAPLGRPGSAYQGPLYQLTIWPLVAALAAPAIGIARAAVDNLIELATKKTPAYTGKTLRDRSVVQLQVAQAEALIGASRAYLHETLREGWESAVAGERLSLQQKIRIQLATSHAVIACAQAVDLVHAAAGATGFRDERFHRHFRDAHVITQHAFIHASRYESVGQLLFGLDSDWPFFAF
jgi:alkylation response protein AidB-like acyl-CoA dehydrogenase